MVHDVRIYRHTKKQFEGKRKKSLNVAKTVSIGQTENNDSEPKKQLKHAKYENRQKCRENG